MQISACFPALPNLSFRKSKKKHFLKNETFGHIEDFLQKFFNMFLEVNSFLRNYVQYFAIEVEQNFMKELSCEQKKKIH